MAVFVVVMGLCSVTSNAQAQDSGTPPRSLWRASWPSFSWVEGVSTFSAGAATLALALDSPPTDPHWQSGILFDDAVRSHIRLSSTSARATARRIGDLPYYAAGVLPLLADPLVARLVHRDGRAAVNMELIALEAFSYAGLSSFVSTRLSVRERPDTTECKREHADGSGCELDTEAFWSGHTTIVAASAGIVCANHAHMPLWGSPAADVSACVLASSAALVTGVSRLAADRHYATDVLVGLGVGFAFGYGVPTLLHYGRGESEVLVSLRPDPLGRGALLSVAGTL